MKLLTTLALCIFLITSIGCSSTKTISMKKLEKRPLISDHYLMMSLLNRPMTEDQKLMLAFTKQQNSYFQDISPVFVNAVMIKGEKTNQQQETRTIGIYDSLIAKDINSIRVSGPF